jgi:aryl-alcohol dehydrogenase-like predicted oxidoreductase
MSGIESRLLGATGLSVSSLGFGGAPIGFAAGGSRAEFVRLVRRACELGITFFDTAPDYRDSEAIIGEALADARRAGGVATAGTVATVATKVGRRQELRGGEWHVTEDWSRDAILRSIERSLEALRTDVLELVQLHSPSIEVLRRGDAQRTLELARDRGLVRHVGLSADGADAEVALGVGGFETLQISYNVLLEDSVGDLIERASEAGLGIIVKQPIANGSLGQDTQRALRWLLSDERLSTAIVGTTRLEHLEDNVAAAAFRPGVAHATRA